MRLSLLEPAPPLAPLLKLPDNEVKTAVIDRDFSSDIYRGAPLTDAIFKPHNYNDEQAIRQFIDIAQYYAWHKWLYLPAFMVGSDIEAIEKYADLFDGVYAEGMFALELCREKNWKLFAGTGFGIFNRLSLLSLNEEHPSEIALSKELSERELENIRSRGEGIFAFGGRQYQGDGTRALPLWKNLFRLRPPLRLLHDR